jgi:hydrogenase-1 operon protein HyaE
MLNRLHGTYGFAVLDRAECDDFSSGSGLTVLLFAEDPSQAPENWDMAVVLPEILKSLPRPWRAGVVLPDAGQSLKTRFGFGRWPAIVILRDGCYLGTIEGLHDWRYLIEEIHDLVRRRSSRSSMMGLGGSMEGLDSPPLSFAFPSFSPLPGGSLASAPLAAAAKARAAAPSPPSTAAQSRAASKLSTQSGSGP